MPRLWLLLPAALTALSTKSSRALGTSPARAQAPLALVANRGLDDSAIDDTAPDDTAPDATNPDYTAPLESTELDDTDTAPLDSAVNPPVSPAEPHGRPNSSATAGRGNFVAEKALSLIGDIHAKLLSDMAKESTDHAKFLSDCTADKEQMETDKATLAGAITNANADKDAEQTNSDLAQGEKEDDISEQTRSEKEEKDLKVVRDADRAKFNKNEATLVVVWEHLSQVHDDVSGGAECKAADGGDSSPASSLLDTASTLRKVLERSGGLIQFTDANRQALNELISYASDIRDAKEQTPAAASLLQVAATEKGNAGDHQQLADLLCTLLQKATTRLNEVRKQEADDKTDFIQRSEAFAAQIKNSQDSITKLSVDIAQHAEKVGGFNQAIQATQKLLASNAVANSSLFELCDSRNISYQKKARNNGDEKMALENAREILRQQFTEVHKDASSSKVANTDVAGVAAGGADGDIGDIDADEADKDSADEGEGGGIDTSLLRQLRSKPVEAEVYGGPSLVQMHSQRQMLRGKGASWLTSRDPFDKVKGMLKDMIAHATRSRAEAMNQKEWCDKELRRSTVATKQARRAEAKVESELESVRAQISQVNLEIKVCKASQDAIIKRRSSAIASRSSDRAEAHRLVGEWAKWSKAIASTIDTLQATFEVQPNNAGGDPSTPAAVAVSSVIGLLEISAADFGKMTEESKKDEAEAQAEFDKLINEMQVEEAVLKTDQEHKKTRKIKLTSDEQGAQTELSQLGETSKAKIEYESKVEEQCVVQPESRADAIAKKQAIVEKLKEAQKALEQQTLEGVS